ncbi:MAG: hypothetical protein MRJ92_05830 [Nitrospira sp.]|nr:hypothetical protein [Nitrospira sp.]
MTAQAGAGAATGSYSIQVSQLAKANQITNKAAKAVWPTPPAPSYPAAREHLRLRSAAGAIRPSPSPMAPLDDLRFAINDLGAGVTASVINTGTTASPAYRLTSIPRPAQATPFRSSPIPPIRSPQHQRHRRQRHAAGWTERHRGDRRPERDDDFIERESNVISDAIPDVTLTLKSKTVSTLTPEPVTVIITTDPDSVKTNIKAL